MTANMRAYWELASREPDAATMRVKSLRDGSRHRAVTARAVYRASNSSINIGFLPISLIIAA